MPATEYQGSSAPFASLGRSLLSLRREQVHSVDSGGGGGSGGGAGSSALDHDLESFQRHVAELFQDLASPSGGEELLSLDWVRKLLDSFLICQEEFRAILFNSKAALLRPPVDRLIADYFERSVKALDVCNAVRDGIDEVRHWGKNLEIVLAALAPRQRTLGEGQLRRAKKALADLTIAMLDEKEAGQVVPHRNRSFGRNSNSSKDHHPRRAGHSRSRSWSVSRTWSAARQLQVIGNNLNAPRNNEIAATNGLATPIFTMSSVLLFVMWALVAAIPCQDRGLQAHFSIPRQYAWAAPILSLHERIMEESKKRDKKNSRGLLKEIHQFEKCVRQLTELTDVIQFPLAEEMETEMRQEVQELAQVCDTMKEGLDPLECQVREAFRRIVRSRTEGMDSLGQPPIS